MCGKARASCWSGPRISASWARLVTRELGQQLHKATTDFEVVGQPVRLPSELELTIFRIAQEALSNVRQHASDAGRVSVAFVFDQREVTLVVEDNGPGCLIAHPAVLLQQGHLGLAGMAERARLLGGALSVESAPEKGTSVILRVPATVGDWPA